LAAGLLTALPRPYSWIKGRLLLREEGGKGVKGDRRGGSGGEEELRRRRGVSGGKGERREGKMRLDWYRGPLFMDPRYAPAVA